MIETGNIRIIMIKENVFEILYKQDQEVFIMSAQELFKVLKEYYKKYE